ncbi:putative membrane protein [Azospirillum fermentarium]|uniref:bestrophin family protein n=1 Tax=Azospirillum fermentarium TaxID=1233114 RepID=UPI002227ED70|nr:bestrophin family ion channel [Azospirillum fermentarium]MCW2249353.1 putative membrane protein [Azospirillum fermentarium]
MIVRATGSSLSMLFAIRGSVVPQIWPRMLVVVLAAAVVVAVPHLWAQPLPSISLAPFSLIGLVLSIFLGFRNNACYDRWWEARKQWGHLIAQARAIGREFPALLPGDAGERAVRRVIGFCACLSARLRGRDELAAAVPWIPAAEAVRVAAARNKPQAITRLLTHEIIAAHRAGAFGEVTLRLLEDRIEEMNAVQAACERIRSTPTPFAYSLLLHRTSWIFCLLSPFGLWETCGIMTPLFSLVLAYAFFGLDALGDELEEPFGTLPNDLPLDAMVRIIEIDLLEAVGEAHLPEPVKPVKYQLT